MKRIKLFIFGLVVICAMGITNLTHAKTLKLNNQGELYSWQSDESRRIKISQGEKSLNIYYFYMRLNGTGEPVYCIQPFSYPITGTGIFSDATWVQIPPTQQENIAKIIQVTNQYALDNGDIQFAGQILIWEALGVKVELLGWELDEELALLKADLATYNTLPSFNGQIIDLKFNPTTEMFEATLSDTNGVLATKFNKINHHQVGDYTIVREENNLKISTKNNEAQPVVISRENIEQMTWQPGEPTVPGYIVSGENGQDTVYGLNYMMDFSFTVRTPTAQVELMKVDEHDNPLEGVEFSIYALDENNEYEESKPVAVIKSDATGRVLSPKLGLGKYVIKETKSIEGYINTGFSEEFELTVADAIHQLNNGEDVINPQISGHLKVVKVNQYQEKLSGAVFRVYNDKNANGIIDESDTLVDELVTDSNGEALSEKLTFGTYLVQEEIAPQNHIKSDQLFSISIDEQTLSNEEQKFITQEIINQKEETVLASNFEEISEKPVKTAGFTNTWDILGIMLLVSYLLHYQLKNKKHS